jgi:hypothetical protein
VNKLNVCYATFVCGIEELSAYFDVASIGTYKLNETLSVKFHLAPDISSLIMFDCIIWSMLLVMPSWWSLKDSRLHSKSEVRSLR